MRYVMDLEKALGSEGYRYTIELEKASAVTPIGGTTAGGYRKVARGKYVKEGNVLRLKPPARPQKVKTGEFHHEAARDAAIRFLEKKALERAAAQALDTLPVGFKLNARGKPYRKAKLAGDTVWTDAKGMWLTGEEVFQKYGRGVIDRVVPGWYPDRHALRASFEGVVDAAIEKSEEIVVDLDELLSKAGPFIGPRGGKWADPKHTIPWKQAKIREVSALDMALKDWDRKYPKSAAGGYAKTRGFHQKTIPARPRNEREAIAYLKQHTDLYSVYRSRKADYPAERRREESEERPRKLPDDPWRYFHKKQGSQLVPIGQLKEMRARPVGIKNAAERLEHAYKTGEGKRDPISLMDNGDGTYTVLDGNSTLAVARKNGWKQLAAVVDERTTAAARAIDRLIKRGVLSGTVEEHVTIAQNMLRRHNKHFKQTIAQIERAVPHARVGGRVKKLDSAINKVAEHHDRYKSVSDLPDATGTRVVVKNMKEVNAAIATLRGTLDVIKENDYINHPQGQYRSHHLICRSPAGVYEVQIRTENQDVMGEWMHDIYKPQTPEQVAAHLNEQVLRYEQLIGEHFWAVDSGHPKPPPPKPDCVEVVRVAFGCL